MQLREIFVCEILGALQIAARSATVQCGQMPLLSNKHLMLGFYKSIQIAYTDGNLSIMECLEVHNIHNEMSILHLNYIWIMAETYT
jgi:hypothetical protein